jgi:hypothetical protein
VEAIRLRARANEMECRVSATAGLIFLLLLSGERVAAEPPPPPPPPPRVMDDPDSQQAARQRALALGPGSCEDLVRIATLPWKNVLGLDVQFDRMVVHFDVHRECLVAKLIDDTPIADPGTGPTRHPYAVGDLAYDVITRAGALDYADCVPDEIAERWDAVGSLALVEWTAAAGNRERLQACVSRQLSASAPAID